MCCCSFENVGSTNVAADFFFAGIFGIIIHMPKQARVIFLLCFLVIVLSGCRNPREVLPTSQVVGATLDWSAEEVIDDASQKPAIVNEIGLLGALAAKYGQTADRYLLHDLQVSGEFARGRFSYDNQLNPQVFWAALNNGSWRVVASDVQVPACSLLSAFPSVLRSGCRSDLNVEQISNFNDCVKAGFTPTNEQPRRCLDNEGHVFVEVTAGHNVKRYVSQDVVKCRDLDFVCAGHEKSFLDDVGCGCQGEAKSTVVGERN